MYIYEILYRWNPLVTAAADAVLDIFEKRHIVDHVKEIGAYLYEKLEGLKDKYDVSVDLIVSKALLEQKMVLISAGANIIRFVPPLIIEKSDVDEMVKRLEAVIEKKL